MTKDDEIQFWVSKYIAVSEAMKEWPRLPCRKALACLGESATFGDGDRGREMRRELGALGRQVIGPVAEEEAGAGLWDRITNGAWRDSLKGGKLK